MNVHESLHSFNVYSAQIDTLRQHLEIFKIGLTRSQKACRAEFGNLHIPKKIVDTMIKDAQSEPQDNPVLKRVYEYCQEIKDLTQKIRETEAS